MKQPEPVVPWIIRADTSFATISVWRVYAEDEVLAALADAGIRGLEIGQATNGGHRPFTVNPRYNSDDVLEAMREWLAVNAK